MHLLSSEVFWFQVLHPVHRDLLAYMIECWNTQYQGTAEIGLSPSYYIGGNMVHRAVLPLMVARYPGQLRPMVFDFCDKKIELQKTFALPHVKDELFPSMMEAAAGLDERHGLTNMIVDISCRCCESIQGCHHDMSGASQTITRAMARLGMSGTLKHFSMTISENTLAEPIANIRHDTLCAQSILCEPCIQGLSSVTSLTRLELQRFGDEPDNLSHTLMQLKRLRVLFVIESRLRCRFKPKTARDRGTGTWGLPVACQGMTVWLWL